MLAGESEGPGQAALFPSPGDRKHVTTIEGLPVLSLAQLIQSKLACGLGNLRRTHKDFADVVELIAFHRLDGSFAILAQVGSQGIPRTRSPRGRSEISPVAVSRERFGYVVRFVAVGPEDAGLGPPTQMGIFEHDQR